MTQVEYSKEEIAEEAFNMLMKMIGSQEEIPERKYLKGKFTIQESTLKDNPKESVSKDADAKDAILKAISSLQETLKQLN